MIFLETEDSPIDFTIDKSRISDETRSLPETTEQNKEELAPQTQEIPSPSSDDSEPESESFVEWKDRMAVRRKARKLLERFGGDRWDGKKIENWDDDIEEQRTREKEHRGCRNLRGGLPFRHSSSSSEGEDDKPVAVHIGGPINGRRSNRRLEDH
jgi:hypothetical protein